MAGVKGRSGGPRKGAGRPSFKPTAEQRNVVEKAAAFGLSYEQISLLVLKADKTPIEKTTLVKYFQAELDAGRPKAIATVAGALYNNAVRHNNVTAQIFFLRTVGKWREVSVHELTGADGKDLPTMPGHVVLYLPDNGRDPDLYKDAQTVDFSVPTDATQH